MTEIELPDHVRKNRIYWDDAAVEFVDPGERSWASDEPRWGVFGIPEREVGFLPDGLDGADAIELGCGTAYVSAWLARRGAHPVGIDNSAKQLEAARRFQHQFGIEFPLIHGNAEQVPLPDASFDVAISEYGAVLWCDPYAWVPEAARLLRPGGRLAFLTNSTLIAMCTPDEDDVPATNCLVRPQFGMGRMDWESDGSVEFHLSHGDWIRLLRANGFDIEELIELRPAADATTEYPWVTTEWARNWPVEEAWKVRKR